jgi:hypothetical protein
MGIMKNLDTQAMTVKNSEMLIELGQARPPLPSTIQFQEIPIGQHFEFRGRRYRKLALSMACDEDRIGNIFQAQTEVLPDPFPSAAGSGSSESKILGS